MDEIAKLVGARQRRWVNRLHKMGWSCYPPGSDVPELVRLAEEFGMALIVAGAGDHNVSGLGGHCIKMSKRAAELEARCAR